MAVREQLAREFSFFIQDDSETYQEIGGINSFDPSPEKNDVDLTKFSSNGFLEHLVATRGLTFTLEGDHLEDETDGSRDTGQERCETLAGNTGWDGMEMFKVEGPDGSGVEFEVSVDAPLMGMSQGGGQGEAASWSATFNMSGEPSEVAA